MKPNRLNKERSPYLKQHAFNPVDWFPWGEEAFEKAKRENKLMIISIGYAACHWCHVMERESFEDDQVADFMNRYFVSVKVDREEYPDVDKIYMSAVQQITGRGGWPLNVVALPDGRTVWGGTYFPKEKWMSSLKQIVRLWETDSEKFYQTAEQIQNRIKRIEEILPEGHLQETERELLDKSVNYFKRNMDYVWGGVNKVPKFPLPSQYNFLLEAAYRTEDEDLLNMLKLTLDRMIWGGLYDQVDGGFARYSTDQMWHVPHFEKMLYDNAQLVFLYTQAFLVFRDEEYKDVVYETLKFVDRFLTNPQGVFFSSLDADSLNENNVPEEGAYYVFTVEELKHALGNDYDLFSGLFNKNNSAHWENGKYHLFRHESLRSFAQRQNLDIEELRKKVKRWKTRLRNLRSRREPPGLDDKVLTSWNAMMIYAYSEAYKVFGEKKFLNTAERAMKFILNTMKKDDGGLWHAWQNNESYIEGFSEDYAFVVQALISLFEVTGEESYLENAIMLTEYLNEHFSQTSTGLFYFNKPDRKLNIRPVEIIDNVIPSSNAVMCENLFVLSHLTENRFFSERSEEILKNVLFLIERYPPGYYYWLKVLLKKLGNFYEIAVVGRQADIKAKEFFKYYLPNKILAFTTRKSSMPLFKNRWVEGRTYIYLCENKSCQVPEEKVEKVLSKINVYL